MVIELKNLDKVYSGENSPAVHAVNKVNLLIPSNQIFGIIGKSGAGKSTLVRLISLLEKPDSGEVWYDNERVDNLSPKELIARRRRIGMIFQNFNLFSSRTAEQNIAYPLEICGTPKSEIKKRTAELLELVGLGEEKKRIKGFSRGMKQRLGIAQALLNSPKLLICDEPTSALDPVGRKEILDVLSKVKEQTTVIFSTHILSDVERICDEVAFLHDGNIVLKGSLDEVKRIRKSSSVQIECFNHADVAKVLKILPEGKNVGSTAILYESADEKKMSEMMMCLAKNDISIQKIEMLEPTLEDLFVEVVSK